MAKNKQKTNWWIDAVMMTGYLFTFYLDLTGLVWHEWLGVAVFVLAAIHLVIHWDWVESVTSRFFKKNTCGRYRWYYLIDFLLALGFLVIIESGFFISTWFNLALENYILWRDIHVYASIAMLVLTFIKIGLHWRWIVNITSKIFDTPPARSPQPALVPVRAMPIEKKGAMNRRQFLSLMGVAGLGSFLAIYNVVSEDVIARAANLAENTPADVEDPAANPVSQSALAAEPQAAAPLPETVSQPEVVVTQPTAQPAPAAVASSGSAVQNPQPAGCVIRCPQGCSYPGRCRRYTDTNKNGKCDLGECM